MDNNSTGWDWNLIYATRYLFNCPVGGVTYGWCVGVFQGKFKQIDSNSLLTTSIIVDRIIDNRAKYIKRNVKKEKKELDHIASQES